MATPLESNTPQQRRANLEHRKRVTPTALVSAAMECLYGKKKTANLFSDPSHRMSQRPTAAVKSGEGLGFQDFGSSFGATKAVVTYGKSSKNKFKPAATLPAKSRKAPFRVSDDDSDDELLLSSQNSIGGDASLTSKRAVIGKKPAILSDEEEMVRVNGRVLTAHPDYKPSSSSVLKGLRFKKNKKSSHDGDNVMEVVSPSSSPTDSQDLFKPISDDIEILDDSLPGGPSSSRQRDSETSLTRRRSPSAARTAVGRFPGAKDSSKPSSPTAKDTPRSPTRRRPQPRVVMKSAPRERESSPESTPRPAAQKRIFPLHSKPELPANAEGKRTIKKPTFPSSPRRELQEFPMSLQAKENVSDGVWSGDASSTKAKKGAISRAATFVHTPKPIPLPSPLGTKRISRGTTFPNLSPLSSQKDKGKARAKSPDEDNVGLEDDGQGEHGGPKPFPMSSQMLAGIDRRSKSPSACSPKRTSSDDSGAEQGRIVKKRKDSLSRCAFLITCFNSAYLFAVPNLFRVLDVDYLEDDSSKPPMLWVILSFVLIQTLA